MFCLNGANSQLSQNVIQAVNILNAARVGSHLPSCATASSHRTICPKTHERANQDAAIANAQETIDRHVQSTKEQIWSENLPQMISAADFNPFLIYDSFINKYKCIIQKLSNDSITDNLNVNLPLWSSELGQYPTTSFIPKALLQISNNACTIQAKRFTTRSRPSVGFGTKKNNTDGFSPLQYVMAGFSGNKYSKSNQMDKMLNNHDYSPEIQEKMKVAFAEGYVANKGDEVETFPQKAWRWLKYGIIIYLLFEGFKTYRAMENMKLNSKTDKYEVNPLESTVTFNDVKGGDEAKQELLDIVEFLKDRDKFLALGAKLPKGVLLVGPPGIGKTLLARAVAGEAGVPFFFASGSEFDEVFVGTGAKRIRELFKTAKEKAPCVIFIDEIDTVGAARTSSQIHPYANQTINQLLNEMDGFKKNEGVIVLGATNRKDNLDKALLRPGRFDIEVSVFPPDLKGRRDIIGHYLKKIKIGPDIDVDSLARGTTGCTGAELENMVNQAALKAVIDGALEVAMKHMEYAKDRVLMGPEMKNRIPDIETTTMTAYHEAGHTLVAFYTKDAIPIHKVTIIPRGMSLGHTSFLPDKEQYNLSKSQLMAQMDVAMGGRVAEEIIYGADKVTTGASSDFMHATHIATAMVESYGMSDKVGVRVFNNSRSSEKMAALSAGTKELVDTEIKRLLQESYDRATSILKNHSREHNAIAKALMNYETLDADDIRTIVEGKKLKRPFNDIVEGKKSKKPL